MTDRLNTQAALELLQRTYQQEVMGSRPEDCPPDDMLAALVLGELEDASRNEIADHVVSCRHCAEAFRVLRQLHEKANATRTRSRKWVGLASAAALLIGLAGYAMVSRTAAPGPDVLRSTPAAEVEPEDGAVLSASPTSLSWREEPGATGYRVRVFAADGSLLWESSETSSTRLDLPPDTVSAGQSYLWSVSVIGPVRQRELGPYTFELQ